MICIEKASNVIAAFRDAPPWRKAVAALTIPTVIGGFLTFTLTGGMDNSAPVWAVCWGASGPLLLWGYAGWIVGRWTVRQSRRRLP